jgi:hypothetical protein
MTEEPNVFDEQSAASRSLLVVARRVGESLSKFSGWLMGGFDAGFSFVLANVETMSKFVALAYIRGYRPSFCSAARWRRMRN